MRIKSIMLLGLAIAFGLSACESAGKMKEHGGKEHGGAEVTKEANEHGGKEHAGT